MLQFQTSRQSVFCKLCAAEEVCREVSRLFEVLYIYLCRNKSILSQQTIALHAAHCQIGFSEETHATECERVTATPNNCVNYWDRGVFSSLWVNQPFKILSALRICPISIDQTTTESQGPTFLRFGRFLKNSDSQERVCLRSKSSK